ncbi:spore germination protein [Bacillus cereus]|uniref:spore germination protein n=1 Tax=Bacillus cereus TaxID=1396 RepID=UPI000BF5DC37|nr:spore germination protein [Bacillus cereus]PFL95371.1 spore germination protein [Bacillus cereus]PFT26988.1 spore germination protein [Bacillus cereus]
MFPIFKFLKQGRYSVDNQDNRTSNIQKENVENHNIHCDLFQNINNLQKNFKQAPDLVIRQFQLVNRSEAALIYLSGLTDTQSIHNNILSPLMHTTFEISNGLPVTIGEVQIINTWNQFENAIFQGDSILLVHGLDAGYQLNTKGWPQRDITEPKNEISLKGTHQGFVETSSQNIALIRRYIPNKELVLKEVFIGSRGKTKVSILYLKDVASEDVLKELETRIQNIVVDSIINTGEIIEFIEDNPYSPFPQFILTERPDSTVSHILHGRYVIVVDRSPNVLIAPVNFIAFFQGIDDYNTRWLVSSSVRLLRFIGFFIALLLPATYVAFISFNYEVIPVQLYLSIAESRERVPFLPVIEALLMEITLEMMREAALRLPTPISQTVGIVGGIVIGQAAVQAGIVSNIMIIIVAVTTIASSIVPNYEMGLAIRLLRFPMMLLAALFGIVGIIIGWMTIIAHLVSLESLGTPYGSPLSPFHISGMKDTFVRFPLWSMKRRSKNITKNHKETNPDKG